MTEQVAALRTTELTKAFGGVAAVDAVTMDIAPGSLTCLIGPNGAGKSTLLRCLCGAVRHTAGEIRLHTDDVTRWPGYRRARAGLATIFQTTQPLSELDVHTNAMVGCHASSGSGFIAGMFRSPGQRREEAEIRRTSMNALAVVGLDDRATDDASTLPLGQRRLLAVATALAQGPRVLLLDEPVAGLREADKQRLIEVMRELRDQGLTQLLVEHDMRFVSAVADRVIVLDRGRLIADGTPDEIRADQGVRAAYLGMAG